MLSVRRHLAEHMFVVLTGHTIDEGSCYSVVHELHIVNERGFRLRMAIIIRESFSVSKLDKGYPVF